MTFKKLKRTVALFCVSALALSALSGCSKDPTAEDTSGNANATATGQSTSGKTFTYAIAGDPGNNVNVITTSDRFGLMTIKMIYSPLLMYNADGINWFLAKDVEVSDDNLTYTFHLRDDVKWSDGQPFTADDVVFTYEAMADEKNGGWAYSQLVYDQGTVKVEKIDDYTVSMTMPFVNASALEMLSNIFIMPKHIYENVTDFENNEFNMNPVGTGPYVMSEYSAGSYVKFSKNDSYFLGTPDIDTIVFQIIENSNTAMLAIQSGEVNAWIGTPSEVQQMKIEENNLKTVAYSEGRVGYLMINANRIKDEKVRQALLFALNRDEMNQACFLTAENYETPWSFIPPGNEYFTENVEKYEQNIEKSKQMLKEAGAENLKIKLGFASSDPVQQKQAVMVQEQLQKVGVTVELAGGDATALSNAMKDPNNEYDAYFGGYIMGIDPDTFSSLFESTAAFNYMHYDYPEIDQLFKQGRTETDPEKRKEIYTKVQQAIQNTGCFYPITSNKRILVISNNVSGIEEAKLVPVYTFEDTSKLKMN